MNYGLSVKHFTKRIPFQGLLLGLFVLIVLQFAQQAFAAGEGNIGAYPTKYDVTNPKTKSWFIYELKPGDTKEDSITIVNNSDSTVNIKVYAVDATTTSDGAFALLNEDQRQVDIGSWVNIAKDTVTIAPRSHQDVPFTISIPKFATVGDHAGGIIIQEAKPPNAVSTGIGLNIVSRVGTRIYETVPGEKVVKLDVSNFTYKIVDNHLVFTFVMENSGNVILTPNGKLDISDGSGKIIDTISLGNLGSVFPKKPTTLTAKSNMQAPWFGKYSATVTINYSNTGAIAKTLSFFIYIKGWTEALPIPIILFVVLLLFGVRKIISHRHRLRNVMQKETIIEPEIQPPKAVEEVHTNEKQLRTKGKHILVEPAVLPMPVESLDELFVARHLKMIGLLISISVIILSSLFAFVLQYFVLSKNPTNVQAQNQAASPAIVSPEPTPTQTPTSAPMNKSDIHVSVLNGSGIPGAAKKIADKLTHDGFDVINSGNAPEDATQTIIQYPTDKIDGANQLMVELAPEYTNVTQEVVESSAFTIILGK